MHLRKSSGAPTARFLSDIIRIRIRVTNAQRVSCRSSMSLIAFFQIPLLEKRMTNGLHCLVSDESNAETVRLVGSDARNEVQRRNEQYY